MTLDQLAQNRLVQSLNNLNAPKYVRVTPARVGMTEPWPSWANPQLVHGYQSLGMSQPWVHQTEAANLLHNGQHTVIATATGSGKSAGFWLPALTAVLAGKDAHPATVLYISPTKALGADQESAVRRLLQGAQLQVLAATCDGDTPGETRKFLRDHGEVLATNPDFLHFNLLPNHRRWNRFLSRLSYVVVDEMHTYRGLFGANVSAVLRRLQRVARFHGADPVFAFASATIADPAFTASQLLGVPANQISVVDQDFSPAGTRTYLLYDSVVADEVETERTAQAVALLVAQNAQVLAFTRSRAAAESVADLTRQYLRNIGSSTAPQVLAYRGGYLPEERRQLEDGIRSGTVRALATTNALELGVDITGLDAVVMSGFPGTRTSWWQQAGRAGRGVADGLVVLLARTDPLDAHLVNHPEELFDGPAEPVVFDPHNPTILAPHLAAAAAEIPLSSDDLPAFGPNAAQVVEEMTNRGLLRHRRDGWYWTHPQSPAGMVSIRGTEGMPLRIVEAPTGRLLGTVTPSGADSQVHPGAVYVHQGETFVVQDLRPAERLALVAPTAVDYRTWSRWSTKAQVVQINEQVAHGSATFFHGLIDVTTQVTGFVRRRHPDQLALGFEPLDLPERTLRTAAVWWTMPPELLDAAHLTTKNAPGALHAAEHAAIGLLPLIATCDRGDLGGLSTLQHPDTAMATIFIHESIPGGAGFTRRGFQQISPWLLATTQTIESCRCTDGCPACIQSPKCGNGNEPLDKQGAVRLLQQVGGWS